MMSPHPEEFVKRKLRFGSVLMFSFAMMTALPLLVVVPVLIQNLREEMIARVGQQLESEIAIITERIQAASLVLKADLNALLRNEDVYVGLDDLGAFAGSTADGDSLFGEGAQATEASYFTRPAFNRLEAFRKSHAEVASMILLSPAGAPLIRSPEGAALPPLAADALKENAGFELRFELVDGRPAGIFHLPVHIYYAGEKPRLGGYLRTQVSLQALIGMAIEGIRREESRLAFSSRGNSVLVLSSKARIHSDGLFSRSKKMQMGEDFDLTVEIADSEELSLAPVKGTTLKLAGMSLVLLLLSVFAGHRVARRFVAPVKSLTKIADAYALEDYREQPMPSRFEEFSHMSLAFSSMVEKIRGQIEELRSLIQSLNLLTEEGRKIARVMNHGDLVGELESSIGVILNGKADCRLFLANSVLTGKTGEKGADGFSLVQPGGRTDPAATHAAVPEPTGTQLVFRIEHPTESAIIGFLQVEPHAALGEDSHVVPTLQALCVNVANTLCNIRFLEDQREQERIQAELRTARLIQKNLLPKEEDLKGLPFGTASFYQPASECGGDWWHTFSLPDQRLLVLIGDVTGHGTASALLTAVVKGYCESFRRRAGISPAQVLRELNEVVRNSSDSSHLMTMFCAIIDRETSNIVFANAGHNFPFLLSSRTDSPHLVRRLLSRGHRLGFKEDAEYVESEIRIEPGDCLFLFTDGLTEGKDEGGVQFSEKKLAEILRGLVDKSPGTIVTFVAQSALEFFGGAPQDDDIAFLSVKVEAGAASVGG